jgi:hypothetical protein
MPVIERDVGAASKSLRRVQRTMMFVRRKRLRPHWSKRGADLTKARTHNTLTSDALMTRLPLFEGLSKSVVERGSSVATPIDRVRNGMGASALRWLAARLRWEERLAELQSSAAGSSVDEAG